MKLLLILLHVLNLLNYAPLHKAGYRGKGVTIAIIDAGFYRANDPNVFNQDRIVGVYDLIADDPQAADTTDMFSTSGNDHGTACLSTMLYSDKTWTGTAPDADYILIRTEDVTEESPREVERLIRAFHIADSLNADVVTVSLGYTLFDDSASDYNYADFNGRGALAQAALQLARHDKIVCVAVGNEGVKPWHYLATPADADSIIAVGAVDQNGAVCSFSSYGPTADGRVKPEVCAWGGNALVYNPSYIYPETGVEGILGTANGCSFATPQIAGLMACLKQAMPHMSAMELRQALIESASLYPQYAPQLGYGIPDIGYVFNGIRYNSAVEEVHSGDPNDGKAHKVIEDNAVVILCKGKKYNIIGMEIK